MGVEHVYLVDSRSTVPSPAPWHAGQDSTGIATEGDPWGEDSASLHASDFTFASDSDALPNHDDPSLEAHLALSLGVTTLPREDAELARYQRPGDFFFRLEEDVDAVSSGLCTEDLVEVAIELFDFGSEDEVWVQ